MTDDILDCSFHGAALIAFVEAAQARQDWPESEEVRRRAYHIYEEDLAARNNAKKITGLG